jgi:hypothetical protein
MYKWCTVEIVVPNQDRLHRWARLLRQQTSITVYRLPTKKNKLPFSVSVGSKQTEVFRFRFRLPIAADKPKLTFSITSDFRIYTQNGTNLHMYGKRNYRKTATSVCLLKTVTENFIYIYIYMLSFYEITENEKRKTEDQAIFPIPFTVYSSCKRKFCCLSVFWRRSKRKLSVCKLTKRTYARH